MNKPIYHSHITIESPSLAVSKEMAKEINGKVTEIDLELQGNYYRDVMITNYWINDWFFQAEQAVHKLRAKYGPVVRRLKIEQELAYPLELATLDPKNMYIEVHILCTMHRQVRNSFNSIEFEKTTGWRRSTNPKPIVEDEVSFFITKRWYDRINSPDLQKEIDDLTTQFSWFSIKTKPRVEIILADNAVDSWWA